MAIQRQTPGDRGINAFGGINVGGGTSVKQIKAGSFTVLVETSAIGQSSAETATFTLSGATTGDIVLVFPSTALDVGLSLMANANVTATSTVTVSFVNETSLASTMTAALTHRYLFFDIT